ncbi:helix-turn-helix domain-containing protein [Brucella tritici]|nr:helix-turn-helix transcriptional regulator [Brucella tritici]
MSEKHTSAPDRHTSKLYLHEWLKKKQLTAEGLAEKLNTSKSVISKLANGRQQYTQDWLERISFVFACDPIALLRDPNCESADEILNKLDKDARERALKVLKALT